MKVMIVSPVSYVPSNSGNSARIEQLIHALKYVDDNIALTFVLCPVQKIDQRYSAPLTDSNSIHHIVLNGGAPYPSRLLHRIKQFCKKKLKKHFNLEFNILEDFMEKDALIGRRAKSEFHQVANNIKPDVIIVEYLVMSSLVLSLEHKPLLVVDTHDKLTDRNKGLRNEHSDAFWLSLSKNQEKALLKRFDYVIAIQHLEAEYFAKLIRNQAVVKTLSILEPPKIIEKNTTSTETIGFIGSNNKHNINGILHFISNSWPKILQTLPNARLLIAGTIDKTLPIFERENITHIGIVNNLADFYSACDLIINPCLSGTGLKIKTVEALSFGKVVVTTEKGGEGLEDACGHGLFIERIDNNEFYIRCLNILNDPESKVQLENKCVTYIEEKYSKSLRDLKQILGL